MDESATTLDCISLTVQPEKLKHYEEEAGGYLTASIQVAEKVYGPALPEVLSQLAVLVLQPDAIARRQAQQCLSFVRAHGFEPVLAVPFQLTPEMSRVLWQYQFNAITLDSKAIGEGVYCYGESLMFLLRDTRSSSTAPGSSRLAGIKGSSDPAKRGPESLRSTLSAINRIFGCVHCPDEPLDIMRELAILFPEPALSTVHNRLAEALSSNVPYDCQPEIDRIYAAYPEHDLDSGRALQRLRADITTAGRAGDAEARAQKLTAMLASAGQDRETLDWITFSSELSSLGIDPAGWDPLLVGSEHIRYELPGAVKLIPSFSGS